MGINKEWRGIRQASVLSKGTSRLGLFALDVLDYSIVLVAILAWAVSWVYDASLSISFDDFYRLFPALLIAYCLLSLAVNPIKRIEIKSIPLLCYFILCVFSYYFLSTSGKDLYLFRVLIPLPCIVLWMLFHDNPTTIWSKYSEIVAVISLISFPFYIGGSFLHIIPETYSVPRIWGAWDPQRIKNYYYVYYESQKLMTIHGVDIWRNCGIFAEAPMFAHVLGPALAAEAFLRKKPRIWMIVVLSIASITTLSTMALIAIVVILGIFFLRKATRKLKKQYRKRALILISIGTLVLVLLFILARRFIGVSRGSNSVRMSHFYACIEVFKRNAFVGCGWFNRYAIWEYTDFEQGISVGIPFLLAMGGLLLCSAYFSPFIHDIVSAIKLRDYSRCIFIWLNVLFLLLNIIEPLLELLVIYSLVVRYENSYEDVPDKLQEVGGNENRKKCLLRCALAVAFALVLVAALTIRINLRS